MMNSPLAVQAAEGQRQQRGRGASPPGAAEAAAPPRGLTSQGGMLSLAAYLRRRRQPVQCADTFRIFLSTLAFVRVRSLRLFAPLWAFVGLCRPL